jgi:hypothetical protein
MSRQILAAFHKSSQSAIGHVDDVIFSALAAESKLHLASLNTDVPILERRQTIGAIGARIFFIADSDKSCLQQANDYRQDFWSRNTWKS